MIVNTKNNTINGKGKIKEDSDLSVGQLVQLLCSLEEELKHHGLHIKALLADRNNLIKYGGIDMVVGQNAISNFTKPVDNIVKDTIAKDDKTVCKVVYYNNQLNQLEKLITTQQCAHKCMKERCTQLEQKLHKVCGELEESRRMRLLVAAEGDPVLCGLIKERQILILEVDDARGEKSRLEEEVKCVHLALEELHSRCAKEKSVTVLLIKERRRLESQISATRHHTAQLERLAMEERAAYRTLVQSVQTQSTHVTRIETSFAKLLLDEEIEREELQRRLDEVDRANVKLQAEIMHLKLQGEKTIQCADLPQTAQKRRPTDLQLRRSHSLTKPISTSSRGNSAAAKSGRVIQSGLRRPQIVAVAASAKSPASIAKQLLSNCK